MTVPPSIPAVEEKEEGMNTYWQMVYQRDVSSWAAEVWADRETFKASRENAALRPLAACDHRHRSDLAAISCASRMRRDLERVDELADADYQAMRRIEDTWA